MPCCHNAVKTRHKTVSRSSLVCTFFYSVAPLNPPAINIMFSSVLGKSISDHYSSSLPTATEVPVTHVPAPQKFDSNSDFFLLLGRKPAIMAKCPQCSAINARTLVRTYPSILSWLLVIGMFVICFPLRYVPMYLIPIAFLPLLCDQLKRSDHYCSKCSKHVGRVAPFSDCGVKTLT